MMCKWILLSLLVAAASAIEFTNPIVPQAPDPWMVYYKGFYYFLATTWDNTITIRKASTLAELKNVENKVVYTFDGHTAWAPEIHQVDNRWYLYYAACDPNTQNYGCHRNKVAESVGDDPMGPYQFKATLVDEGDPMELDPTLIKIGDKYYLIGSTQQLYIRELSNPFTLAPGRKAIISSPTYDWERVWENINEGPEPLYHDNRTFVVYSASSCNTSEYKLGLLEFVGSDPLNITHWKKNPTPVFQTNEENHVYGPGHNGFFKSPDGTEDWIVYHANDSPNSGLCTMVRSARAQKFTWGDDGLPIFGVPVADDVELQGPSGEQ
ncbi:uncharacterized protein LOC108740373 [Agrilus planipennis]|uniref:Uncharacterized protein LOC108740373 n=1 Tax=Agrilus planipennis TaxID=224129 RepID=A0A1W4XBH4_AGRPL|nr:uncharacterized protein LOC108740373 [Agrilus planipennis]